MNFNLKEHTVFLTLSGSRAYGTHTHESDYDYRGIAIPPADSYIGLNPRFENAVDNNGTNLWKEFDLQEDSDVQIFELTKFARLAVECNPSVIEVLFTDPSTHLICDKLMKKILDIKESFLSKQARPRFSGYALSQLNRIRLHRRYILNPITKKPERASFGLPENKLISVDQLGAAESIIDKKVNDLILDINDLTEDVKIILKNGMDDILKKTWKAINNEKNYPSNVKDLIFNEFANEQFDNENFLIYLAQERKYNQAKKDWDNYQHWLKTRNVKRLQDEINFAFDLKHATHLVRLLRMCREILETGTVNVLRPDAEELISIRNGAWTYDQLVEFAENEDEALKDVCKNSKLPNKADHDKIHNIIFNMIAERNFK